MLNKLAFCNAKRSMKDYLIYFSNMTAISAMMFAFNSLIFSRDIQVMCSDAIVLGVMLGIATFFIIFIVAWLINYMAKFMLEKRSREFATYLLIGLKRNKLSYLYMKENLLIGTVAFFLGMGIGFFLQQIIMTVFYSVFDKEYKLHIQIDFWCILMTVCCYFICYILALLRNKRVFKKMTIAELLRMEKENDKIKVGHERVRQLLFFVAVLYILFVYVMMIRGCSVWIAILLMAGFVLAIYFLFFGVSAFLVCRVQKKGKAIYHKNRIFIYRQLASKVRTMRFTMGTLTILLICALLGCSFSLMFVKYQDQAIEYSIPFDVIVQSPTPRDDFSEEIDTIAKYNKIQKRQIYQIYKDGSQVMNKYFGTHVTTTFEKHVDSNGKFIPGSEYYTYDTYMKLSDYNTLRKMLGIHAVSLEKNEYAIQTKPRIARDFKKDIYNQQIKTDESILSLSHVYTDAFSQNGINGADYLIIVPDEACENMFPYYSVLVADIKGEGTSNLLKALNKVHRQKHHLLTDEEYDKDKVTEQKSLLRASGTDEMVVMVSDLFVRDADASDAKFVIASITFPLVYIAFIFIFVALTILSVQQLSDTRKYKFRYDVLRKLGLKKRQLNQLIFRQLFLYYLVPAFAATAISSVIAIYAGNQFVHMTGASGSGVYYFGIAFIISAGIYVLYFIATYISFKRNVT